MRVWSKNTWLVNNKNDIGIEMSKGINMLYVRFTLKYEGGMNGLVGAFYIGLDEGPKVIFEEAMSFTELLKTLKEKRSAK